MAYDKHVWACGEAITTEKLNHMEDGIASGGGYECTQSEVTLTNESVTTGLDNAYLSYTDLIDADTLIVYFDGTRYECPKISNTNYNAYGGYTSEGDTDFSEYPFAIRSKIRTKEIEYRNSAYAQTAGSHTIKLKTVEEVVNTTECFDTAARKAVNASGKCVQLSVGYTDETNQKNNNPIVPTEINYRQFKNTEAISIAQGQYGTVTLYAITTTKINMMFAIMNIYVADNGHLPPITSIRVEPDPNNNGEVVYKVEMYARDSAISIANGKLILDALSFEPPARATSFCVVEGTCCEEDTPE